MKQLDQSDLRSGRYESQRNSDEDHQQNARLGQLDVIRETLSQSGCNDSCGGLFQVFTLQFHPTMMIQTLMSYSASRIASHLSTSPCSQT